MSPENLGDTLAEASVTELLRKAGHGVASGAQFSDVQTLELIEQ